MGTVQMLPWLAKASNLPSGDQLTPVLPPVVEVSFTGQPPSEGMRKIWPSRMTAKVLPSGEREASPKGSRVRMSCRVRCGECCAGTGSGAAINKAARAVKTGPRCPIKDVRCTEILRTKVWAGERSGPPAGDGRDEFSTAT